MGRLSPPDLGVSRPADEKTEGLRMTDLQDRILDRLVGTWVGVNWPDGPLAIAADVVGGHKPVKFGQTDNDRGPKGEIARRLGYPVLLCEAIQGANRGLKAEDDRRGLAIALFGA